MQKYCKVGQKRAMEAQNSQRFARNLHAKNDCLWALIALFSTFSS